MRTLLLILTMVTIACNPSEDERKVTDPQVKTGFTSGGNRSGGHELVQIPVSFSERAGSFALASATNFQILLDGCLTGWTTTATAAVPSLDVYKNDRECKAKLIEFEFGANTYVIQTDFPDWAVGDTAIFENENDPTDVFEVRIMSTLDDPVSGTEAIDFQFYQLINGGTTDILANQVGDAHTLSVGGQTAPAFIVHSVSYGGTTPTGGGKFTFILECNEAIVGNYCAENSMANITYKLIKDEYMSTPTLADVKAEFAIAGDPINLGTDIIPVGGSGTINGGFTTIELAGPDAMHLNPNMLLILRVDGMEDDDLDNDSFTYFNVDVEVLSYP